MDHYQILDTLPEDDYNDLVFLASEICGTPIAAMSLVDKTRQWFKAKKGLGVSETPRDIAFCAHAILEPDITVVSDVWNDERFSDNPLVTADPRIRFYAGAPLVTPSGEALGTLCVIDQVERKLTEAQLNSLRVLSEQVMAQLELRRLFRLQEENQRILKDYQDKLEQTNALLKKQSVTDDVSGFHNTRFLHSFLDHYLSRKSSELDQLTLVFFDMDRFKEVVDTHGHLLGAKVLREVAEVVHEYLDAEDRIVRYGGDEYIVLLPGQGGADARAKVEAIRHGISSSHYLRGEGIDLNVTASFGLATYPDNAQDKKELLLAADQCLFQSKKEGKNRISVSGP